MKKIIDAMKRFHLFLVSCLCLAVSQVVASEKMHILSTSPDKRFAVAIENWYPPSIPEEERVDESKTYLIEISTNKKVNCIEEARGEVSAIWNNQSDGVIVLYHYGRISGSNTLKAKRNKQGELEFPFSEISYPNLTKSLPPNADSQGGTWYFYDSGWTQAGDLRMTARIGDNTGQGHVDTEAGGYELHLRINRDNKAKVIKAIRISPTR